MMIIRRSLLAAAFALSVMGAAGADELRPIQGRAIALGQVTGIVYYTVEGQDLHVVATLAQGQSGEPVRIEAMLAPGQSMLLSAPRGLGKAADTVELRRYHDQLVVEADPVTN